MQQVFSFTNNNEEIYKSVTLHTRLIAFWTGIIHLGIYMLMCMYCPTQCSSAGPQERIPQDSDGFYIFSTLLVYNCCLALSNFILVL